MLQLLFLLFYPVIGLMLLETARFVRVTMNRRRSKRRNAAIMREITRTAVAQAKAVK